MPNREAWLSEPAPQREAILTALERLLAWPEIARSPQLGRFLDYIVRRTLDGDEQAIKAYSIAVDVFGRAVDFDPQVDPIVRVQARRLRGLLDEYYRGPGSGDIVHIQLPVGRYIPEFVAGHGAVSAAPRRPPPGARPARGRRLPPTWFALAGIALASAVLAYAFASWGPRLDTRMPAEALQRPTITIVEFQNLAGPVGIAPQVAGLAIELVTDLEQFGDITVRYGGGGGGGSNIVVAGLPSSDYVLTGIVRPEGNVVQYSAILTENLTSTVVWNKTLAVPAAEAAAPGVLDMVAKSLSLVLGSPRGPLHVRARQWLTTGQPRDDRLNLYLCRMLFDLYRETGGAAEAERAGACFAALSEQDRQSATALAASASLLAEHPASDAAALPADRVELATVNLEQAIGLNPINAFVWEQQGWLHDAQHDRARARVDFSSSVQLNPANADALAAYARLLAFEGNLAGAEAMARDAADQSPSPPPWYQGVPTLLALRDGDFADAIKRAELYALADRELGPVLAIMAGQGAGDSAVVNRYLPQVLDVTKFRAGGVLPSLRERIGDNVLLEAIRAALLSAGVPQAALTEAF